MPRMSGSVDRSDDFHLALDVSVLECRVFKRDRDRSIDEEQRANPELGTKRGWKPHSILLPLVHHIEADPGQIGPEHRPHHERNTPRELGEYPHGFKFGSIDICFPSPGNFVFVLRTKCDVVNVSAILNLLPEQAELVVLLLVTGQREEILRQSVFRLFVRKIVAKVLDQVAVKAVLLRDRFTLEALYFPLPSIGR